MSGREIDRVGVIRRVAKREMRQKTTAKGQRLVPKYVEGGSHGLVSKKRG